MNIDVLAKDTKYIKALAKHIDKLRLEREWTFQQMADACEMDKSQAFILCRQGENITALTAVRIAKGFEITVSQLFDFKY